MRNFLFLILIFYISNLWASNDFLYIDSKQTEGLKNFQVNELNKISLQLALETEKYQILFNKPTKSDRLKKSKKFKFTYLILKVSSKNDVLNLEYGLLDVSTRKYIKKVRKENVLSRKFLLESKNLLEQLFGKKKRKETKNEELKNIHQTSKMGIKMIFPLRSRHEIQIKVPEPFKIILKI